MDLQNFVNNVENLVTFEKRAFKLDDILGTDITAGDFLGDITDAYGTLIIESAANGKPIPDEAYESFWNMIFTSVDNDIDKKEIEIFYEEITANE